MRAEAEAFIAGFALAWRGLDKAKQLNRELVAANKLTIGKNERDLFAEVKALADELWPPFDEPPQPVKASKKGQPELWEQREL